MGTTALIVEMVIIGFQVLVWISIMILVVVGYKWIDLSKLKDWAAPISIAFIGVSYTLGIIFDGFIRSLFYPFEPGPIRMIGGGSVRPAEQMAYVIATNTDAADELYKMANRSSLIRATAVNLLIISISSLVF